jgi:hypothetical protein
VEFLPSGLWWWWNIGPREEWKWTRICKKAVITEKHMFALIEISIDIVKRHRREIPDYQHP